MTAVMLNDLSLESEQQTIVYYFTCAAKLIPHDLLSYRTYVWCFLCSSMQYKLSLFSDNCFLFRLQRLVCYNNCYCTAKTGKPGSVIPNTITIGIVECLKASSKSFHHLHGRGCSFSHLAELCRLTISTSS